MSLLSGTRLGPYEIVDAIGAGGMGEVYRPRDTRLDRAVAIEVLPERGSDLRLAAILVQNWFEELKARVPKQAEPWLPTLKLGGDPYRNVAADGVLA